MGLSDTEQDLVDRLKPMLGTVEGVRDDRLYELLVEHKMSFDATASAVWAEKAARYGDLIDVSEGSSRRPLSQLATQARSMAEMFTARAAAGATSTAGRTVIRRIER